MFGRILIPLDGSCLAELALKHAEALARVCGAEILLLRILEQERGSCGIAKDVMAWEFRRVEAQAYLGRIAERLGAAGIRVRLEVEEGDAAERILGHALAHAVDLLVLTSHGAGGVTAFEVAGTARKVLSRSSASVLLVPARDRRPDAGGDPLYRTVLAPVDCSQRGEVAVNIASRIARSASAELVLVHVIPEPELTARMPLDEEDLALIGRVILRNRQAAERYLGQAQSRYSEPGHPVRVHASVARDVARELTEFLSRERPELVVICAHGSAGLSDRSFGAVARSLLTSARIPLLVTQDSRSADRPVPRAAAPELAAHGQRSAAHDR